MSFWSRESRARRVIDQVPAYRGRGGVAVAFDEWLADLLPWLLHQDVRR
jgi:hypothetical protein